MSGVPPAGAALDSYVERVLEVVRELALEVGGPRAVRAVSATASLERDVGLGSLERVELLVRLEEALGRELDGEQGYECTRNGDETPSGCSLESHEADPPRGKVLCQHPIGTPTRLAPQAETERPLVEAP